VESKNLTKLAEPFGEDHLEWRVLRSGSKNGKPWAHVAPFIKSREIMARLDEVCGPADWQVKHHVSQTGVITEIGIKIDGEWVWKADGAGFTDVESFKGGVSDGLKRAGVPWGIGRYLYDLPGPMWAEFVDRGKYSAKIDNQWYGWNPPSLSGNSRQSATPPPSESPQSDTEPPLDVLKAELVKMIDSLDAPPQTVEKYKAQVYQLRELEDAFKMKAGLVKIGATVG